MRTQELVSAGSIPRGDLLDLQATVAQNNQQIVLAENVVFLSKLALAQLLQLPDFKDFDIIDTDYLVAESPTMMLSANEILAKAKAQRIEIKIAQTNLEIAEKDVKIARGTYQPSISGFYSVNARASDNSRFLGAAIDAINPTSAIGFVQGTNQTVLQPNFAPIFGGPLPILDQFKDNKGQNFGLQLNIPILNGLAARTNVARSKINVERTKIALSQENLTLERNVFTAFADAKGALKSYEAATKALEARTLALDYAKERFNVGMMNSFDLSAAQTLFINAQTEVIRTKFDYIFKVKVVEFYFGIPIIQN
jgi:outer membrane protein